MYILADFAFVPMTTEKYSKVLKQWNKISNKLEPTGRLGNQRRIILGQMQGQPPERLSFLKKNITTKSGKSKSIVTGIADIQSNELGDSVLSNIDKQLGSKKPSRKYLEKTKKDITDKDNNLKAFENRTHVVHDLAGNPKSVVDPKFKGATKSLRDELLTRKIPDYDKVEIHPVDASGTELYNKYLGRPENKDSFLMREVRNRKKVQ